MEDKMVERSSTVAEAADEIFKAVQMFDTGTFLRTVEMWKNHGGQLCEEEQLKEALLQCCAQGSILYAEKLLHLGVDVDTTAHGTLDTPLILSAKHGHLHIIDLLLDRGANIIRRNSMEHTALDIACKRGCPKMVNRLIKYSTSLHLLYPDDVLSSVTVPTRDENASHRSLERKAKGSRRDFYPEYIIIEMYYTALATACEFGHPDIVNTLVNIGIDVNQNLYKEIGTALHSACEGGDLRCINILIAAGADVEAVRDAEFQTPLMRVCEAGHVDAAQVLLVTGCDVNQQTKQCSPAIIVACHYGHEELVNVLLEGGADPHKPNPWGYTALYMARESPKIVQRLLREGVKVDTLCGERGEAALHVSSHLGFYETAIQLLHAGANVDIMTPYKETPLWLGALGGHVNNIHLLLQWNCQLNVPSNGCHVFAWEYLPVEISIGKRHDDITKLLITAGCSLRNKVYITHDDKGIIPEVPWVRLRPEVLRLLLHNCDIKEWVVNFAKQARSLKDICRILIRKQLGHQLRQVLQSLQIPSILKAYIRMEII